MQNQTIFELYKNILAVLRTFLNLEKKKEKEKEKEKLYTKETTPTTEFLSKIPYRKKKI